MVQRWFECGGVVGACACACACASVRMLNMGIYLDRTLIQLVYIRIRTIDTSSTGTGTGTSTVPVKKNVYHTRAACVSHCEVPGYCFSVYMYYLGTVLVPAGSEYLYSGQKGCQSNIYIQN